MATPPDQPACGDAPSAIPADEQSLDELSARVKMLLATMEQLHRDMVAHNASMKALLDEVLQLRAEVHELEVRSAEHDVKYGRGSRNTHPPEGLRRST